MVTREFSLSAATKMASLEKGLEPRAQPHHVIIAEAFPPLIRADIAALPCRAKVRERSWEFAALLAEDGADLYVVERTFINVAHRQEGSLRASRASVSRPTAATTRREPDASACFSPSRRW